MCSKRFSGDLERMSVMSSSTQPLFCGCHCFLHLPRAHLSVEWKKKNVSFPHQEFNVIIIEENNEEEEVEKEEISHLYSP